LRRRYDILAKWYSPFSIAIDLGLRIIPTKAPCQWQTVRKSLSLLYVYINSVNTLKTLGFSLCSQDEYDQGQSRF